MSAAAAEGQIGQWVQEAARTRRGGTALATATVPGSLPSAWPHRSGPERPSACAMLRHWSPGCAQLSPPPAQREGRSGCPLDVPSKQCLPGPQAWERCLN